MQTETNNIQDDEITPALLDSLPDKKNHKVNKAKAFYMACNGKSYSAIAEHFKVTKQAISVALKPFRDQIEATIAYTFDPATAHRVEVVKLLNSIDDAERKKMSPYQREITACAHADKAALFSGNNRSNTPTLKINIDFNGISLKSVDAVGDGSKTIDIT